MTIHTNPSDRKAMVHALSEHMQTPAVYMRTPTYAFQIGGLTVNRDGSITGEDEALLESLRPLLVERGWLNAEVEPNESVEDSRTTIDASTEARVEEAINENVETDANGPSEAIAAMPDISTTETPVESTEIVMPLHDWTVQQLTNLLRVLYGRQYILNRMLQSEKLYIDEVVVDNISKYPPRDLSEFGANIQQAVATGHIRGIRFALGEIGFIAPRQFGTETDRAVFNELMTAVMKNAKSAVRVSAKLRITPENEKYYANSFLMQLGFCGPQYKELRRLLLGHLNGYAAFKSKAAMQAHCLKHMAANKSMLKSNGVTVHESYDRIG